MNFPPYDCEHLFFEVLERAIRFLGHVEESRTQAARPNRRRTAQEAIAQTLTIGLTQNIESLVHLYNNKNISEHDRVRLLHYGLQNPAALHNGPLSAVPRPHEPIELVSYIRQAQNSYPDGSRSFSPPHVFATEILGDQAHSRFDRVADSTFKTMVDITVASKTKPLGELIEDLLVNHASPPPEIQVPHARSDGDNNTEPESSNNAIGFVSLPRIDLANPLRWPSLIHETGHFEDAVMPDVIWEVFCKLENGAFTEQAIRCMERYLGNLGVNALEPKDEIRKWLVECWCDAHAVRVAGVPAFFSQMHAFLFSSPCYLTESHPGGAGYPPAWFRLRLTRALITDRHKNDCPSNNLIKSMVADEWGRMEKLFPPSKNANIKHNGMLRNLFAYFHAFLTQQFQQGSWHLQSNIDEDDLNELIDDLSVGLPIPTHRKFIGSNQTRASHAEILLAGWHYRNTKFKDNLLSMIEEAGKQFESTLPQLLATVERADAALQMSIQVSEWFAILAQPIESEPSSLSKNPDKPEQSEKPVPDCSTSIPGLLPDKEIVRLLLDNSLRIIPLIGGTQGVAGTVVDVRLGHNFEIFFTNISGAMDPLNRGHRNTVDSMEVDYDSLDGLEIAPGQFVLGHTLEYLKLPNDIAAEINGRSSFARLGIEVHMTAPFVEAGFDGCLTLEIANSGHSTVKLYPGMRVAQLRFYRCASEPDKPYRERSEVKYRGRMRHNKTAQFNDWEIGRFEAEQKRRKPS